MGNEKQGTSHKITPMKVGGLHGGEDFSREANAITMKQKTEKRHILKLCFKKKKGNH